VNPKAVIFDAYGTLFDLRSAIPVCERIFPGHGAEFNALWRVKLLRHTRWCVITGRYRDLWQIADAAIGDACRQMKLRCSSEEQAEIRQQYLELHMFPEVPDTLRVLRERFTLAVLSHGTSLMLRTVAEKNGSTANSPPF